MRDTISARSVKEALGQVSTWRAEVGGVSGQGHRSHGPWLPRWAASLAPCDPC